MTDSIVKVEQNAPKKKIIGIRNIQPISNIKIVRDHSDSDISSDADSISTGSSDYSSESDQPRKGKKTKKVLRRKVVQQSPTDYNVFSNPKKISKRQDQDPDSEPESEYSSMSSESGGGYESDSHEKESFADKQKLKQDLLIKIQALEKKGFEFSKKFSMTSNYDEIAFEYEKVKKFIESQAAIKFSRRCLMACVTGLEFVNKKFDPFSVKLDGWSENVMENVDDYDNIFEKLHEKYASKAEIAPEIELLLTLGGSAFMFHLTNSLLKSPVMNGMGGMVAQNNPNFMANMMGAMSQGMKEMGKPPPPTARQQPQQGPPKPMDTRGIRKEMSGPNIDHSLFNGTPLMHNYPKPPQPVAHGYFDDQDDQDDRYSVASSDSSLSSAPSIKRINTKKGNGGGIELNIS
jgi:hypothetical protein